MRINAIATNVKEINGRLELVPDAKAIISFGSQPYKKIIDKPKEGINKKTDMPTEQAKSFESEIIKESKRTLEEQEDDMII